MLRGAYTMRPGVNADFMTSHVLFDQDIRTFNDTRTNNEEGCAQVLFVKVAKDVSRKGSVPVN